MMLQLLVAALLLPVQVLSIVYKLEITTGSIENDSSDGDFYATLIGESGSIDFGHLDTPHDDFELGATDEFTVEDDKDIGIIECVVLTTESEDAWRLDAVVASRDTDETYMYNVNDKYLSLDESEGVPEMQVCSQGSRTYTVAALRSGEEDAEAHNIAVRIKIFGRTRLGSTIGFLGKPTHWDMEQGTMSMDTFSVQGMKNVGTAKCIELLLSTNKDDAQAWRFDQIKVIRADRRRQRTAVFKNMGGEFFASDDSEGKSSMELCRRKYQIKKESE